MSINTEINAPANVSFFSDVFDLAVHLRTLPGSQIFIYEADYDMDAKNKMLVNQRGSGRGANGIPNPFIGKGLRKLAVTQVTVNFNYEDKRESRGGEAPETQGNWIQPVIVKGKITPLATHKGDVIAVLKEGIDPNSEDAKLIRNYSAVLDENGSIQFNTDTPRLYLRYEIIRAAGEADRSERSMRSKSLYVMDGAVVPDIDLESYMPATGVRTDGTDVQLTTLDNVVNLKAGGRVWVKRGYAVPVIGGKTFANLSDLIDKCDVPAPVAVETTEGFGRGHPIDPAKVTS